MRLDHIGVQVRELAPAIELFSNLFGYTQATQPVVNTRHGVEVVFLEKPGSMPIKLFRAVEDARPAPPRLHHLCFQVDDVPAAVEALAGQGARVLNPPAPGEAFDDELIAFMFAGGLNVELISTERRRGRILK
jgi:catechol 2,3-dioxygenase-like lactoylglutathione lyase family enzyme